MVLDQHFDRMAFNTAVQIDEFYIIPCGLRNLRRDETIRFGQVIAAGKLDGFRGGLR
jgi:hypothetical protein